MATEAVEIMEGAGSASDTDSMGSGVDDSTLAMQGITMLINNQWKESEEFFGKYKNDSPLMSAGSSFVTFMQALMSFEDDKLAQAMKAMQETEKLCQANKPNKYKIKKNKKNAEAAVILENKLQCKVVMADCMLYQAMLTFINQDLPSMIKGGWMLRKAYKIYEKTYKEIKSIYERVGGSKFLSMNDSVEPSSEALSDIASNSVPHSASSKSLSSETGNADALLLDDVELNIVDISPEVAARLMGAVCFGYGVFQLSLSLVPPKILKIIEFLGFEGDRHFGLESLEIASHSKDMKSPLATMALVWYHTVIRPFFALDGNNLAAGVPVAEEIIARCAEQYPDSSLYLFFKGRVLRLKAEPVNALEIYRTALERCEQQRELQLICLYEIGWLNMMMLNWSESLKCFIRMKVETRWSKCYYTYLTAVCQGALGDVKGAHYMMEEVPGLVRKKNNQIESFVNHRAEKMKKAKLSEQYEYALLGLEVLYLWNALPTCRHADLEAMLEVCNSQVRKSLFHIRSLIEGAIYRELGNEEMAIQCMEEAIARHHGMKDDHHIAAFAAYELGTLHAQTPKGYTKARSYYMQAKEQHKDYDFDNRLTVRVNMALKRLGQDGTPV